MEFNTSGTPAPKGLGGRTIKVLPTHWLDPEAECYPVSSSEAPGDGVGGRNSSWERCKVRSRDLLLVLIQLVGMAVGVLLPHWARLVAPMVLYFMMSMLFLSFLHIEITPLVRLGKAELQEVFFWTLVKLGLMPLALWALTSVVTPSHALAVLLLSGVSTGVVAPFLSNLLGSNTTRVIQVVVLSSLLVPVTLPAWVKALMGADFDIPFLHMVRMLAMVILLPMCAAAAAKRWAPGVVASLNRAQYPISLCLFFLIISGIFSSYSGFILDRPKEVLVSLALACAIAALAPVAALILARVAPDVLDRLTGAVCLTFVNNVLIVVFAFQFFDAEAPLVAALYMVPFFAMMVPLRWLKGR